MARAKGIRARPNGDLDAVYRDPDGSRVMEPIYDEAGRRCRNMRYAVSFRARRIAEVAAGTWVHWDAAKRAPGQMGPRSGLFADDWAEWLATRVDVITVHDDEASGRLHILPTFGKKRTDEITAADIRAWLAELRRKTSARGRPLSNNYIHNIATRLRTFFSECEVDDLIVRTPFAKLRKLDRTRASKQHEISHSTRFYTRDEIEYLISHLEIPIRRRVLYALQFFPGARFGEAAGFRWFDYDESSLLLAVHKQYEGRKLKANRGTTAPARVAPVHPELRAILDEWRHDGFRALYGRAPNDSDYIVPAASGLSRPANQRTAQDGLRVDLLRIGSEPCGQTHGFRRAMVTIAESHGAPREWIERVIHNRGEAYRQSHRAVSPDDIGAMRRAIECIPVRRRTPDELASMLAAPSGVRRHSPRNAPREDVCEAAE